MKRLTQISLPGFGQLPLVCILAATLTACGGGTTTGEADGESGGGDSDSQSLIGGENEEIDTDNDGLFDFEEALIGTDPLLPDTDNDGVTDDAEDSDNDGVANLTEILAGTDPAVADNPDTDTGGEDTQTADRCDDFNSDTPEWADNCWLHEGGTYATSSYTRGVQRILWCQGFDNDQDLNTFADGIFGSNTDQAVRDFQDANDIRIDGVVGPQTWGKLFEKLTLISNDGAFDVHTIDGPNCDSSTAQFYQEVEGGIELKGWKMAEFPGSTNLIDFGANP